MAEDKEVPAKGGIFGSKMSARYTMAVLASIGMGIIYGLKVNLHTAIVSMVNHTALAAAAASSGHHHTSNATSNCGDQNADNSTSAPEDGPFDWSFTIQGWLLSSYFLGYLISQLPGARIAELFSAKFVMFFAVSINVICTILTPFGSNLHYGALLILRVFEGIGGGVTFPAMHVMLAHWAPPNERSVMSSIVYAGTALGTVTFTLLSGVIAAALGWQAVFYLEGGVSALWLLLWFWLIADSPQQQRYITTEERVLISEALSAEGDGHKTEHPPVPWKAVLTSPPFLAILTAHTCSNWGWYMVLIELPSYMKSVLNFKISSNAVLSSIPFFAMWVFSIILSKILDGLLGRKKISTTIARKTATLIASLIPLICFLILCYLECQRALAVLLLTIATMSIGGMFCGFLSNHIDISPNFAGTLMAITNSVATFPGIIVPNFVGYLTEKDPSIRSWRIIFWTTIVLYVVEIIVYMTFGSGEVQKWNQLANNEHSLEEHPLKSPTKNNDNNTVYKE